MSDVVAGATALWAQLVREVDFFGTDGPPMADDATLVQALQEGALALPQGYRDGYVVPVQQGAPRLLALARAGRIGMGSVEIVTGGIAQHAPGWPMQAELRRFIAVISNLYRSFLDAARRNAAGMPALAEMMPPLAAFQHNGSDGPITIAADLVSAYLGGNIGVVALPATFAGHPVLWLALAHETGGHDVTHADAGLLDELAGGLPDVLAPFETAVGLRSGQLVQLWSHWLDEAAADIYAVMNAGPAFIENAAIMLAAMGGGPAPRLRMESRGEDGPLDSHPTDILRVHLGIGATETLAKFSGVDAAVTRLRALAIAFGSGDTIRIDGGLPAGQQLDPIAGNLPRTTLEATARAIGRHIATARLQALGGKSIQAIETWDDADQVIADAIRAALSAGHPIIGLGDDAQLLAAASAAAIENPENYGAITEALNAALDHSFQTDPIWGFPAPDRMYLRYRPRDS